MEVYSGQKHVRPIVTASATLLLLAIAILQSFSMVFQKQDYWRSELGPAVEIDDQLSIRIPREWRLVETYNTTMLFEPKNSAAGAMKLLILRLPPVKRAMASRQVKSRYLETLIRRLA